MQYCSKAKNVPYVTLKSFPDNSLFYRNICKDYVSLPLLITYGDYCAPLIQT